jgi:hypothetical protein
MSFEAVCNFKEMKLHHKYTPIYTITLTKQSSSIQKNKEANRSQQHFVVTQKVACSSHISSEVTVN